MGIYKTIKPTIENMNPKDALKILRDLEEKKTQVNNPTRWIKKAAESSGFLDEKVNLAQPIQYDEVKKVLGQLSPWKACKVLSTLADGKGEPIRDPTAWICKGAQKQLEGGAGKEKAYGKGKGKSKRQW